MREVGYIKADWSHLGHKAGSVTVGANRLQIPPGRMPNPPHLHGAEEEIFYVLSGSGLSWQDGETFEVRAGDCIVHVANTKAHTLRGGDDGLDVLVFGQRVPVELATCPGRRPAGWAPAGCRQRGPSTRGHADADRAARLPRAASPRPQQHRERRRRTGHGRSAPTVGRKVRRLASRGRIGQNRRCGTSR